MAIPGTQINEKQGGAVTTPSPSTNFLVIGPASSGASKEHNRFATTADLVSAHGYGHGPHVASICIESGKPTYFARVPSTAGSCGAVTHVGTGATVMTVDASGDEPFDSFNVIIKPMNSGTIGTNALKLQYSLNGGISYSPTIYNGTALSFTIPKTGLIVDFTTAAFVAGDTYSFAATGPTITMSDVTDVIDALKDSSVDFDCVYLADQPSNSDMPAFFTKLDAMKNSGIHLWGLTEVRVPNSGESDATYATTIESSYSGVATNRGGIGAWACRIASPLYGTTMRRSQLLGALNVIAPTSISENAASIGGHSCNCSLVDNNGKRVEHDARWDESLSDKFLTLRTWAKQDGVYLTLHRLASAPADNLQLIIHRRLFNAAEGVVDAVSASLVHRPIVAKEEGNISDLDGDRIETLFQRSVEDVIASHCSRVIYKLDRSFNVVNSKKIKGTLKIQPFGYPEFIETDIFLVASLESNNA